MDIRKNLFSIRVVNGWNQLPEAVKGSMTLYASKTVLTSIEMQPWIQNNK